MAEAYDTVWASTIFRNIICMVLPLRRVHMNCGCRTKPALRHSQRISLVLGRRETSTLLNLRNISPMRLKFQRILFWTVRAAAACGLYSVNRHLVREFNAANPGYPIALTGPENLSDGVRPARAGRVVADQAERPIGILDRQRLLHIAAGVEKLNWQ